MTSDPELHLNDVEHDEHELPARPPLGFRLLQPWFALLGFIEDWLYSRTFSRFKQGLPAVLAALLVIGVGWTGRRAASQPDLIARYKTAAEQAMERSDLQAADVYLRKLAALDTADPVTRYNLALAADERGDEEFARHLMEQAAPSTHGGYARAHFWLAQKLLAGDEVLTKEAWRELYHHLVHTVIGQPDNAEAHAMLAQIYLSVKEIDRAVAHLEPLADRHPRLGLILAGIHAREGRHVEARQAAERAGRRLAAQVEADPADIEARLLLAQAQVRQGHFAAAAETLAKGRPWSSDPRYSAALADLYVEWSDTFARGPQADLTARLELLQRAVEAVPDHEPALSRLAMLVTGGTEEPEALAAIERALAAGTAPLSVHLILGSKAAQAEDFDKAKLHLEQAYRLSPQTPTVLNNLAWTLANAAPPDLHRAAELSQAAVETAPRNPEYRETRGQILAKLGRWQEALTELETALRSLPDRWQIHATLALVYENLGDPGLAEQHRKMADEKRNGEN